jgi:hypothetical protein
MVIFVQCNLDLVTLLVSSKTVTKSHNVTNRMVLCSKLKNGLCKIVAKSQVVTKFNVTKSRLHCISLQVIYNCSAFGTSYFCVSFFREGKSESIEKKKLKHKIPVPVTTLYPKKFALQWNQQLWTIQRRLGYV